MSDPGLQKCLKQCFDQFFADLASCRTSYDACVSAAEKEMAKKFERSLSLLFEGLFLCSKQPDRHKRRACKLSAIMEFGRSLYRARQEFEECVRHCQKEYAECKRQAHARSRECIKKCFAHIADQPK